MRRAEYDLMMMRRGGMQVADCERPDPRLRASRIATGFKQKEFAALLQLKTQTYNNQEINGTPSIHVMRYLLEGHRIDFNFILHGDFVQLPGDVQDVLFEILSGEK